MHLVPHRGWGGGAGGGRAGEAETFSVVVPMDTLKMKDLSEPLV